MILIDNIPINSLSPGEEEGEETKVVTVKRFKKIMSCHSNDIMNFLHFKRKSEN